MNEKIRNTIIIMRDRLNLKIIKKISKNCSKRQKLTAGSVVGVLALATILAITPMVPGTPADMGNSIADQPKSNVLEKGTTDIQWLISIGGKLVLAVDTQDDATAVFEGLKSYYLSDKSDVNANVVFDKEFRWDPYDSKTTGGEPAWVMNVADAIDYIIKGTATPKTYVVQGGDTVWDISIRSGLKPEELEQMNPGITVSNLKIGSVVNLYESKPFLAITTTETIEDTEVIPYETIYEETTSMYRGQSQVKTEGVTGSKQVTAQVVKQNGVVISSNVLDEQILLQAQNQVSLKGTASTPEYIGSSDGILSAPMGHIEVSSPYGASRGSRRHAGVDLRNPKGTVFGSAADGVVVYAAYSKSYGNIIKVDHGDGLQTYYAHCDSMYVSVGETVTKGQAIGTVGSTGNATGNVLHFEVRLNGVAKNPMNYI